VVDELRHEFANLKRFATLSPMPGFRSWLDAVLADGGGGLLAPEGAKVLIDLLDQSWPDNPDQAEALRAPLMRLGAHYLIKEKRGAGARDPVENFHLTNGARLERINWLADTSAKGLRQSAGLMVNYLYRLKDIEANHEAYSENGRIVASGQARNLLKS